MNSSEYREYKRKYNLNRKKNGIYNVRGTSNGMLKVRKGDGQNG